MSTSVLHPAFEVTPALRERFEAKTIGSDSGCRIWIGATGKHHYGAFRIGKRRIDAHVASWRIAHGGRPVPVGFLVMHLCDCRPCVNPEHLQLGTTSENMKMAHADGRGDDFHCRGEDRPDAILTDALVRQIHKLYVPNRFGARRIARMLSVPATTVEAVLKGRTWKHVSTH